MYDLKQTAGNPRSVSFLVGSEATMNDPMWARFVLALQEEGLEFDEGLTLAEIAAAEIAFRLISLSSFRPVCLAASAFRIGALAGRKRFEIIWMSRDNAFCRASWKMAVGSVSGEPAQDPTTRPNV